MEEELLDREVPQSEYGPIAIRVVSALIGDDELGTMKSKEIFVMLAALEAVRWSITKFAQEELGMKIHHMDVRRTQ